MEFKHRNQVNGLKPAPKFIPYPDVLYIQVGTQDALPINKLKKTVALFPDHQKSLLSYLKRRKLSNKKEALQGLWKYYQSLD